MAGSVNRVILVGNVGSDPETRRFDNGNEMAEFSLATSETWRDRNSGERREKTEWHKIKVMNDALVKNVIRPFVKKGSKLYVEGQIETEKWRDRDGNDRYTTKVVLKGFGSSITLLSGREEGERRDSHREGGSSRDGHGSGSAGARPGNGGGGSFSHDMDDDIPFAPEWR
ncbi:MAG: single-stranded DNA-binding protein [Rhizobiales bacterium 63-7]|nr:single-stranded DNA-binding protein [Hyphomicrobiales bacterium]OJU66604.1 MAG: single-stranded DNA-binding protein [Rhizobiales bacterium 63-7]